MSKEIRQWASRYPIKSRAAKAVLRTLAWMAGSAPVVSVSHQRLAKRTGYCRRTVVSAIQQLADDGAIEVDAQRGARGRQAANQYTLRVSKQPASRVQKAPQIQSAKIAPLYTEVVIYQGKNEPRDTGRTVVVEGDGWDGGWPPPDPWLGWPGPDPDAWRSEVAA